MKKSLNEKYLKYYPFLKERPKLIFRIIRNYIRIFLFKEHIPRTIALAVTFNCQCSCKHCSSAKMKNESKKPLSLTEIKKIAEVSLKMGIIQANLTGGEPLLRGDIGEIIGFFKPDQTIITISTNGLLLTIDKINELKDYGVAIIKISLDSPDPGEHDLNRGVVNCYDQALRSLKIINKIKGIRGMISTLVTRENIDSGALWKLLTIAEKNNAYLGLNIPILSGNWTNRKEMLIREKDKETLDRLLAHPLVIKATHEGYRKTSCPAGNEEFYITQYGDVLPCPFIQISFGDVRKKGLQEIWREMNTFPEFARRSPVCLGGQDEKFIEKYITPISSETMFPVPIKKHPSHL